MPSSYEVESSVTLNEDPEVVFDFLLFFFRLNPDSRFLVKGSLTESERLVTLNQGRVATSPGPRAATQWDYPNLLVLEHFSAPFLKREVLKIQRMEDATKLTWTWRSESRNLLEKVFIAIHRRGLNKMRAIHQSHTDRVGMELTQREESGIGEHFDSFRSELHG